MVNMGGFGSGYVYQVNTDPSERSRCAHDAGLTVVIPRDGRHADADCRLLGDRMDCVGAVDIGEG